MNYLLGLGLIILQFPFVAWADSVNPDLLCDTRQICTPSQIAWHNGLDIFFPAFIAYLINVLINSVIIFCLIPKNRFQILLSKKSILRILGLTILGLVVDILIFGFAPDLIGGEGPSARFTAQTLRYSLFTGFLVAFFVALNFYWIYSSVISNQSRNRIWRSIIFGLISNPVWIYLISHFY